MARRTSLAVGVATSLMVAGLVPLALSAASAEGGCPAWTDPVGDATTGEAGDSNLYDANMDITNVAVSSTPAGFTATIKVAKLTDTHSDLGDEFDFDFTVGGQHLQMYTVREETGLDDGAAIYNFTSRTDFAGKAKVVYDVKASTVTLSATTADINTAAGSPVVGKPASALSAATADYVFTAGEAASYDSAATTLTVTMGTDCAGGGSPAPTTTASASPTATATASPTPTATASPTPSGSASPPSGSTDPATEFARPGCVTFSDPKGDAHALNANNPAVDPDLDITGLTMRTTANSLVAYIGVDKLAKGPAQSTDGHRYTLTFTFNKHVFSAAASSYTNGTGGVRDALAQTGQAGRVVQLGVDTPAVGSTATDKGFKTSGLKATFDLKNSRVVLDLPIADIVKYGGAPFEGDITVVDAKSATDQYAISSQADTTAKVSPSTDKWTVGDNACFGPPPAVLTNTSKASAQYGDAAALSATLKSAAGEALAGKKVTFGLAGKAFVATTDAKGVAKASIPVTVTAGAKELSIAFAGDETADKASLTVPFTVAEEKTKLALIVARKGTARTATATLLDDDNHAVSGQKVVVSINGKTVATLTTSSRGQVSYAKGKPGQTIKFSFARVTGKYVTSSVSAKL